MVIFSWIVLGFAGLLVAGSGACWGLFLALDNAGWRKLAVKVFRIAMVFVLFYINVYIYAHIFGVAGGTAKPVIELVTEET